MVYEQARRPLADRLRVLERGSSTGEAVEFFDACAPVGVEEMLGRWKGSGLFTGHPLDGLLEAFRWHGKRFDGVDEAHPLVFRGGAGVFSVNPAVVPMWLATRFRRLVHSRLAVLAGRAVIRAARTGKPKARLRMMEYRGVSTATMSYDALPINDHFRRVEPDTLLGVMDLRGVEQPFFFVLRRESRGGDG